MIDLHSKVTLHFSLMTAGDLVIDSTFDKGPASFVMGDGSLLPGFEKCLLGLKTGDENVFLLTAKDAFGEINPDSIHAIDKRQFKNMDLSEGLIVSFDGAGKMPMPGVVKKIESKKVIVDFNHPLAGQTVTFTVKIVSVEDAPVEQMIKVRNT